MTETDTVNPHLMMRGEQNFNEFDYSHANINEFYKSESSFKKLMDSNGGGGV